eukprot:8196440-Karenia_brevis.AAC.1
MKRKRKNYNTTPTARKHKRVKQHLENAHQPPLERYVNKRMLAEHFQFIADPNSFKMTYAVRPSQIPAHELPERIRNTSAAAKSYLAGECVTAVGRIKVNDLML